MSLCDFKVHYDPDKDTGETVAKKIIASLIVGRIKHHKPAVLFISGDSGEGKSYSALKLQEWLAEIQKWVLLDYYHICNIHSPLQYMENVDKLLHDPEYKKANILCIHEARDLINSKDWESFLSRAISDVNALSRAIKRLIVIIISQFIRDITKDIRYTINYYIKISRPKGKKARMYFYVMWKDDRDPDNPKLRKRKLCGYLVYPNGKHRQYRPEYIILPKPSKELCEIFEKADREAKTSSIRQKLSKVVDHIKTDMGLEDNKVNKLIDWYAEKTDNLNSIGRIRRNKWKTSQEFRDMHDLNKDEVKRFEEGLNNKLKDMGLIEDAK